MIWTFQENKKYVFVCVGQDEDHFLLFSEKLTQTKHMVAK